MSKLKTKKYFIEVIVPLTCYQDYIINVKASTRQEAIRKAKKLFRKAECDQDTKDDYGRVILEAMTSEHEEEPADVPVQFHYLDVK